MSTFRFSQFSRQWSSPRKIQLLVAGTATFTVTAAILHSSSDAYAEDQPEPNPTFGAFGFQKLQLDRVEQLNHDTKRLRFRLPEGEDSVSGLKLTSALLSMSWPKGDWRPVLRPYTPVSDLNEPGHLDFIIKQYPGGRQSSHVHSLQPGDSLTFFGKALPGYKWSPNKHSHVLLIAGGAGITPIYQLTRGILNNPEERTKVTILWGTNTDDDVFLEKEFDDLSANFPGRFSAYYTVSRPGQQSPYPEGRITQKLLQEVIAKEDFDANRGGMVFLCGPPALEKWMEGKNGVLANVGIGKDKTYRF